MATSGENDVIYLWSLETGQIFQSFTIENERFFSTRFSPVNQSLASGNNRGAIRIWDVKTSACRAVLQVPRPYEGVTITGAQGLTVAQRASMLALGAVDHSSKTHPES